MIIGWCICVAVFLINVFVLRLSYVASESMEPNLKKGEFTIINMCAYKFSEPQRGDVICFDGTNYVAKKDICKRVVGIPGDKIDFYDGNVYINGIKYEEIYLPDGIKTESAQSYTVPEKCVFVLGDNRDISLDSRYFENPYVSYNSIKGKFIVGL